MSTSLNIPVPESAYRQPRLVLKNRRARRNRALAKPELSLVACNAAQAYLPPLPAAPQVSQQPAAELATTHLANHHLSQAVLLDWLGSQPVAFHRIYVDVCGSVTAAVWLSMVLSLLDGGKGTQQVDSQGVFRFTLSASQCEAHTGLTDREQRKAQQLLVACGLLKVIGKKAGQQAPSYELEMNALTQRLLAHSEGLAELIRNNASAPVAPLDVATLERRAQARASRRRA